jgi:hypothetical protein
VLHPLWLGLAWLGLAWLGLAWLGLAPLLLRLALHVPAGIVAFVTCRHGTI